jgi:YbbR domain-containing protein
MSWRETVTKNLGLKALSLLLAALLWLFVAADRESEREIAVPVVYRNLSPALAIVNKPPSRLDLWVAGPKIMLMRLNADRLTIFLDLKNAGEGATSFPGPEKAVHLPEGVRVTRVTPASVEVSLARK